MKSLKHIVLFILLFVGELAFAQDTELPGDTTILRKDAPILFFDCSFCDQQFYRQNIKYVNFVRDRRLADVYILLTQNYCGNGGCNYSLFFQGSGRFAGMSDTLKFDAIANAPSLDVKQGILEAMKKGLLPYLLKTPIANNITYEVKTTEENTNAEKIKDKWNFWTFNINGNGFGNGNSYSSNFGFNGNLNANRTTEKFKTETGGWYFMNKQKFQVDDTTTVTGIQSNAGGYHLIAFSIGKHWAAGHFATYFTSLQSNLKNSTSYFPGIEYNVFPYDQASRRQLRFIYRGGIRYQDYFERTIYDQTYSWYFLHSFVVQYSQIEKWGSVDISAGGFHYFNYPNNYNASIYPSINFNPAKGLRVGVYAGLTLVNDQFFISAQGATADEILLNQKQLQTDYNYNFGFNINYTFGSMYNNIINVRFNLSDSYW